MKGKLIVIEGLDGSGKATQTARLFDTLTAKGVNVRKVSFPNYESDSSAPLRMYLSGKFGSSPDAVNPYAASSLFAVDRFAGYKSDWGSLYDGGGTILPRMAFQLRIRPHGDTGSGLCHLPPR